MNRSFFLPILSATGLGLAFFASPVFSDHHGEAKEESKPELKKAVIDGTGQGWRDLAEADFVNVNCKPDTWSWKEGVVHCTGDPVGVIRSKEMIKNFEMVCEWKHLKDAGNSGVFAWASQASIDKLTAGKGALPDGIEV
ncbi:DUF1080 domain-containing protein, partial [bacterium]|nr:DUF1080 domain-containing protein [bacterium]